MGTDKLHVFAIILIIICANTLVYEKLFEYFESK